MEIRRTKTHKAYNNAITGMLPGKYDDNFANLMESFKGKRKEI